MNKKIIVIVSISLTVILLAVVVFAFILPAVQNKVPEGYTAEHGENLFWEAEDLVDTQNNTVIQDPSIRIYNYAPSIFQEDENTRYAFYCSNRYTVGKLLGENFMDEKGNNQVTDYIAFRKGVKVKNIWYWSKKTYVLSPLTMNGQPISATEGTQTCDPSVVKGEFNYDGEQYSYLMSYLACSTRDNQFNHICLAVAKNPEGPWVRCANINPLIEYTTEGVPDYMLSSYLWGYGQASMINIDKKGTVLMFYSAIKPFKLENGSWAHNTVTTIARYNFSDLSNPVGEILTEKMNCKGIIRLDPESFVYKATQVATVTNGEYVYNAKTNRIYGVTDPGSYNVTLNTSMGAPIFYIEDKSLSENPLIGDIFKYYQPKTWEQNSLSWTTIGHVKASDSVNYPHCHNTGFVRDAYGWTINDDYLEVILSASHAKTTLQAVHPKERDPLWTYRLIKKTIEIKDK